MGSVSTGTSHFAEKDGGATVVTVGANVSNWALADETKFAKAADAGAPPAKPDGKLSQTSKGQTTKGPPKH